MNRKFALLPVMGVMALGAAACGDDDQSKKDDAGGASGSASNASKVSFTSPSSGATVGSKFTAKVELTDFEVNADAVGKKAKAAEGHLHFSLDDGKFDSARYSGANGKLAEQLGTDGKYSPSVMPEISYDGIPAGKHTLEVALANNDHSDTGAKAKVTLTVGGDAAAQTGNNGERVSFKDVVSTADGFTADVALANVELAPDQVGKKAKAGQGHLHFELDGGKFDSAKYSGANGKLAEQLGTDGKYSPAVMPTITYRNLRRGRYVLKVYVANNDHSETGAVATRTVTVG